MLLLWQNAVTFARLDVFVVWAENCPPSGEVCAASAVMAAEFWLGSASVLLAATGNRRPLIGGLSLLLMASIVMAAEPPAPVQFETQVAPLFKTHCTRCHGETSQKAGLNLSSGGALLKGAESGAVIVPGKPDESTLYELIHEGEMPPGDAEPLAEAEVALVRRWIEEGAKFAEPSKESASVTEHDVTPLLLLRCTACHGGRRREADLDLRTRAGILKGGKSGPAAVPGKPEESLLVKRVRAEEMPPRRLLVSVSVKPMEKQELARIEAWIAAGLPESNVPPDVATTEPDLLVTDEDRQFWSFQPPKKQTPTRDKLSAADAARVRNAIDVFVLAKLREAGLGFAPEADRATLYRRVAFDLVGLPPAPEEVAAFVADPDPLAYEKLVDRLLASPRYGERWARHWLDVAGYADSEGSQNEDRVRPNMWRYRDYVIRAFNSDKPYDRFLHEQLAGDELADYEQAPVITDEIYDNLVATGFLRTAPDRTFANITNFVPDRLELIADEIQILGSSVMGLTLHCCRCHTHKFDPLPQRDYYRLAAALKDGYDEHDWLGPEPRHLKQVTTPERNAWLAKSKQIDEQLAPLKKQLETEADPEAKKKLAADIAAVEAQRPPEPTIRALWSRGEPSPTFILKRGNYLTAGPLVGPGVPSMLTDGKTPFVVQPPWPGAKATGRRLALAKWLTSPEQPLTARVFVNRLWKHHFGTGLVTTLGNFGKTGSPPSHPALLDWLAVEFVESGWSIKAMHRQMVCSSTYRQSSQVTPRQLTADPDNRLLSRMPLHRLEAETLRDSLLAVAGQLDLTPFGPPDDVDVRGDGLVTTKRTEKGWRRSIFVLHRRTKLPTLLENFDSPQMGPNCVERGESIVAPQALHLLNNKGVHEWASLFAERVVREAGKDPDAQLRRAHELAYSVKPTEAGLAAARESLAQLTAAWLTSLGSAENAAQEAPRRALQNYCHALFNSAAFVYVD